MNVSKYVAIFSFVFIQLISVGKVFANADEWMTTFRENIAVLIHEKYEKNREDIGLFGI